MKLHENQLNLIRHLIRFNLMAYEDCLEMLDTDGCKDQTALSYAFRPLTKNKYLSKSKKGVVSVLKKGRELFPEEVPLISIATGATAQQRVLQVSRVAMWLGKCGVPTFSEQQDTEEPYFIPSACWRKIALGILSTTRFAGMLMAYDKRYAVYDIGDGNMEWQVRAESSLFYYRYGSFETKAHGMILICEDCRRDDVAKQIIRQTMWSRKSLLKEQYSETDKPVRYSRSPIKLRAQYEHVYLTTPALLATSLKRIYDEEETIETTIDYGERVYNPKEGNWVDWPKRYFLNPAFDILLLVYFFSAAKSLQHLLMGEWADHISELKYILCVHQEDLEVAKMYPDVTGMKEVSMYVYRPDEDSEED